MDYISDQGWNIFLTLRVKNYIFFFRSVPLGYEKYYKCIYYKKIILNVEINIFNDKCWIIDVNSLIFGL